MRCRVQLTHGAHPGEPTLRAPLLAQPAAWYTRCGEFKHDQQCVMSTRSAPQQDDPDQLKRAAALRALDDVREGMVLGLGSGTTAEIWLAELANRVRDGLRVSGVPTSRRIEAMASRLGVPVTSLDAQAELDMTVDGADEVDPRTLDVLKGHGGALVREKLVALATRDEVIIVDGGKVVSRLGEHQPVAVAIVPFGWQQTARRLEELRCSLSLRTRSDGSTFESDDGLYLLDCKFGPIADPKQLAARIERTPGVVEHGLFLGLVRRVIVAAPTGLQVLNG